MSHLTRTSIFVAVWAAIALMVWIPLVPTVLSATTFLLVNAVAAVLLVIGLFIRRDSRPDPSMSQILYDVENPAKKGR
ncbi:MAG: hypothetical protein MUF60_06830 [Vicinamibacterales bacterium]|nr:hypothetical protein [Vicinamibacterales bacterium]